MMPMISEDARLIVWPGVGSHFANMNFVVLQPGERNVPHAHHASEDTIYILSGRGSVQDLSNDMVLDINEGDVVHVPVGLVHAVRADKGSRIQSIGGPSPPDLDMLKEMGIEVPLAD